MLEREDNAQNDQAYLVYLNLKEMEVTIIAASNLLEQNREDSPDEIA